MSKISIDRWKDFELGEIKNRSYGIIWPKGTSQLTIELKMFHWLSMNEIPGLTKKQRHAKSFRTFLRIVQMLLPFIEIYKDTRKGRIWNNYFLDIASELCWFEHVILTGPASANKTFICAAFDFVNFVCAPTETLIMVSTTSGSASERRIWADIKDFHRTAKFEENGMDRVGEIIEYLKIITFDKNKAITGDAKARNERELRNSISVIPIAPDDKGEAALATIQGSKNRRVFWTLDEMTHMNDGITRPCGNLAENEFFMFKGIGNASRPDDPHGTECMPRGGLDNLDMDRDRRWRSATGKRVLFLHGDESPNNHKLAKVYREDNNGKAPFPYTSDPKKNKATARAYGFGDVAKGMQTIDYWKFKIGFWSKANPTSTLFSKALFSANNAFKPADTELYAIESYGAGDFGFTSEGDDNVFSSAKAIFTTEKIKQLKIFPQIEVKPRAEKKEYVKLVASEFAEMIKQRAIKPKHFSGDIGNDGSVTMNEISRCLDTYDLYGVSSSGAANRKDKYANRVTELYYEARLLIMTGVVRGIDENSPMIQEIVGRTYKSVGKGQIQLERKKEMKKRLGRSPDHADAFVYLCDTVIRAGLFSEEMDKARTLAEVREVDLEDKEESVADRLRDESFLPRTPLKEFDFDNDDEALTEVGSFYDGINEF